MTLDDIRNGMRSHMPDVIAGLRAKAVDHAPIAREAGYSIRNEADEAVVRIYDEIWFLGVNALDLAADLDEITAPNIRVEINSPGGDVWDGVAIYNALRAHPAKVTTRVDGIAASIASVIAQAGDHRVMLGGSQMMIHNAWGLTVGDHGDHEDMASMLMHQDDVIAGIYAQRSGGAKDDFKALMDAETWLTAEAAVELGLADEVIDPGSNKEPEKPSDKLSDRLTAVTTGGNAVLNDVEGLVAAHADAGSPLTEVKRGALAAFVSLGTRAAALLNGPEPVNDAEYHALKLAAAKRDNEFRASLPPHLL